MSSLEMIRPQRLAEDIVVIDGMSCSGKTLVMPLLSTLNRGELWLMNYFYEYFCTLDHFGKIERDASRVMVNLSADMDLYNLMIGRNTNFRGTDLSGAPANFLEKRTRERLKIKDGDAVVGAIRKSRPILYLMTHYIFGISDLLFDAFGARLKALLVTVRHPLWLVESWAKGRWDTRLGIDPREFQLCYKTGDRVFPWFAKAGEKKYASGGSLEQAIRVTAAFSDSFERRLLELRPKDRRKVTFVPFELFIRTPRLYLEAIAGGIGTKLTRQTARVMKTLKLPRAFDRSALDHQRRRMEEWMNKEKVSKAARKTLDRLCVDYEKRYFQKAGRS